MLWLDQADKRSTEQKRYLNLMAYPVFLPVNRRLQLISPELRCYSRVPQGELFQSGPRCLGDEPLYVLRTLQPYLWSWKCER